MDQRPIGIFDSGLGGLTVVKEIIKELPHESIVYFGDTARIPYGSKSKDTIIKYSRQIIKFLLTQNVKAIIIACNTASATALIEMKNEFNLPIIGVVTPGAKIAASMTKNNKVGIIATETTIQSGAYGQQILNIRKDIELYPKACPLLVPLVEQGWVEHQVTQIVLTEYLEFVKEEQVDTVVLGCTHYPLLINVIQQVVGTNVTLVNPAEEAAKETKKQLQKQKLLNDIGMGTYQYFVSDDPTQFERMGTTFLQREITHTIKINIEIY